MTLEKLTEKEFNLMSIAREISVEKKEDGKLKIIHNRVYPIFRSMFYHYRNKGKDVNYFGEWIR